MYAMEKEQYEKLLSGNITKDFPKLMKTTRRTSTRNANGTQWT